MTIKNVSAAAATATAAAAAKIESAKMTAAAAAAVAAEPKMSTAKMVAVAAEAKIIVAKIVPKKMFGTTVFQDNSPDTIFAAKMCPQGPLFCNLWNKKFFHLHCLN